MLPKLRSVGSWYLRLNEPDAAYDDPMAIDRSGNAFPGVFHHFGGYSQAELS